MDLQQNGRSTLNLPEASRFRAAEYVRMSTEHQQYSTQNQIDKIRSYAEHHGVTIVKTYADEGKSGLRIEGRVGLQQLIKDVEAGSTDFSIILVYDVSRWGRFQDADESAYYEYVCRRAGIKVEYCAEQFANDGSPVSTIVKSVKRAMAGEYSRELSTKVFAGQCRLIELGFRQGGTAGFGLRRVLVDLSGQVKGELARGEHKSLQTDRVILKTGPETEVQVVKQIYNWFIDENLTEADIARRLNAMGIKSELGRDWSSATVHEILTNEKYVGNNVYNRVSFKLKKLRVVNSPEMWIRKDNAFAPVVERTAFEDAQEIIRQRSRHFSNEELLERLRSLYQRRGFLSGLVIDEAEGMPSSSIYAYRFGSLIRAYQMIGYAPDRDYRYLEVNRFLRKLHPQIVANTEVEVAAIGGQIQRDPTTDLLTINREFSLSIVLARCQQRESGRHLWKVRFDTGLAPDITVAVRLAPGNEQPLDYYLLPRLDFGQTRLSLAEQNAIELESYRFDTLEYLYGMASHVRLRRVA